MTTIVESPNLSSPLVKSSKVIKDKTTKILKLFGQNNTCLMEIKQPLAQASLNENFTNLKECLGDDFRKILE
jgi:hypothetical protein